MWHCQVISNTAQVCIIIAYLLLHQSRLVQSAYMEQESRQRNHCCSTKGWQSVFQLLWLMEKTDQFYTRKLSLHSIRIRMIVTNNNKHKRGPFGSGLGSSSSPSCFPQWSTSCLWEAHQQGRGKHPVCPATSIQRHTTTEPGGSA